MHVWLQREGELGCVPALRSTTAMGCVEKEIRLYPVSFRLTPMIPVRHRVHRRCEAEPANTRHACIFTLPTPTHRSCTRWAQATMGLSQTDMMYDL